MTTAFRCSVRSDERAESQVGTASTVRAFLLIEATGAWGVDAVRDNGLPRAVSVALARLANRNGVRVLMIRRHGRSTPQGIKVFAVYAHPVNPWQETARLTAPADLLELDLAALGVGRSPGLAAHPRSLFLVCTHGKHDVCCAERGRPVAAALHAVAPDDTWEVSHIGGDRFAGNMLVLPDGLYYGRLTPESAVALAARQNQGHLALDHLRGRCGHPFPVQAAEIFLREELGCTALRALALTAHSKPGPETGTATVAAFTDGAQTWTVRVKSAGTAAKRLTCGVSAASRGTTHNLVSITPG